MRSSNHLFPKMMPPAIWRECLPHFCAKVWKDWILSSKSSIIFSDLRYYKQYPDVSSPFFPAIINSPQANTNNSTSFVAISCQGTWCVHRSQPLQLHFLIPCFSINKPPSQFAHDKQLHNLAEKIQTSSELGKC